VTHPFHPLFGQELDFVMRSANWNEDRAFYQDPEGCLHSIPVVWTDLVTEEPFNVVAAGRAALRTQELLDLAGLIKALQP
jgi:Family of unknown function (DUF5372)